MKWKYTLLNRVTCLIFAVSIGATYYKTAVLEDFTVTGISIEFLDGDTMYIFFVYDNIIHELNIASTDYNLLLLAIADKIGKPVAELDETFLDSLQSNYDDNTIEA